MKKLLFLVISLCLFIPVTVNATGGGLRKSSIKTCPNGVTYGMHSDGHGGTHWHVAITNGTNYYANGSSIDSDPCPGYNKNEGTAGATNGSNASSSGSSNSSKNNSSSSGSNNNVKNNTKNIPSASEQTELQKETVIEKSEDNSIKKITIDDEEITISDNMNYQTEKKYVKIKIETTDSNAKVEYENPELAYGDNVINIIVTAENGNQKKYILTINKIKVKGKATIKNFILGAEKVKFENNKATITKLKNESFLEYSYELSDENAKLKIYLNDKETTELKPLKENDKIKLVVIDENDNENVYEVTVTDASNVYSFIAYGIVFYIFLFPIIGIIVLIIVVKKKKSTNKEKCINPKR